MTTRAKEPSLREVVLLYSPGDCAAFVERVSALRRLWGEQSASAVVAEAVRRATEAHATRRPRRASRDLAVAG